MVKQDISNSHSFLQSRLLALSDVAGYTVNMKFRIIDLSGGFQKDCSFQDLSTSLCSNCIILRFKEDGFESIGLVTHHTLVFFTVEFISYALQNYIKKIIPEAQICIDLTRKWLEDQSSVSDEELRTAAFGDGASGDGTFGASYAVGSARSAVWATTYADVAADRAACEAHAAGINKLDEQNRQATFILNFFGAE